MIGDQKNYLVSTRPERLYGTGTRTESLPTLEQALRTAAEDALRTKMTRYVLQPIKRVSGALWWKRWSVYWIPALAVEANHNTVESIQRWGVRPDSLCTPELVATEFVGVSADHTRTTWLMRTSGDRLVTVRRMR